MVQLLPSAAADCHTKSQQCGMLNRPLSKRKAWVVTDIIRKENVYNPAAAAEAAAKLVEQQRQIGQRNDTSRGFAASGLL